MRLLGKKALVTGAARGIGWGCAWELAREGADVVINDLRHQELAAQGVEKIRALGRQAWFVQGDAFERSSCERVVQQAIDHLGQIDILVSNPAFSRRGEFLEYDPVIFEKTLAGTLTAGFHMSQFVARHMVAKPLPAGQNRGKIIFISSVHARVPYIRAVAYNAAKSGLIAMAQTMAAELLPYRINVNAIEPGWIDTPGEHESFGDAAIAAGAAALPWGRLGVPADIGRTAAFLASADADYITGTSLLVDGGLWLRAAIPAALPAPTQAAGGQS